MNNLQIILFFCSMFLVVQAQEFSISKNPQLIQEKIITSNRASESLKAYFVQEKHMSILNKPFISAGHFLYKAPDKVRWEYTEPFSYIVILVNNYVSIKDGSDLQNFDMSKNAVFKEVNRVMSGMVSGRMLEDKNFQGTYYESSDQYKAILVPQISSVNAFVEEIHLYFNKQTLQILSVEMIEKEGDKTVIKFLDTKVNEAISDELFKNI